MDGIDTPSRMAGLDLVMIRGTRAARRGNLPALHTAAPRVHHAFSFATAPACLRFTLALSAMFTENIRSHHVLAGQY